MKKKDMSATDYYNKMKGFTVLATLFQMTS
jgi:hypothetical protein